MPDAAMGKACWHDGCDLTLSANKGFHHPLALLGREGKGRDGGKESSEASSFDLLQPRIENRAFYVGLHSSLHSSLLERAFSTCMAV